MIDDWVGRDLGRFHITERLGEGGMALVFRAYDTRLERDVAVKVILPGQHQPEQFLKRFEREAKSLARLTHPNIVRVLDYGEQEGVPYLVMEYISGGTLKALAGKPMPSAQAARLLAPVAHALAYAHQMNIIHRDIKPANILITASGSPMLSDFGIAKVLDLGKGSTLTTTGVGIGTPEYMSPEQARGMEVDARTDIYALGVVFYELVTGRRPYDADTPMAVAIKHVTDPLPRPKSIVPDLPDETENVIFKALAKSPQERFPNMDVFARVLDRMAVLQEDVQEQATQALPLHPQEQATEVLPVVAPVKASPTGGVSSQTTVVSQPAASPAKPGLSGALIGILSGLLVVAVAVILLFATGVLGGGRTGLLTATPATQAAQLPSGENQPTQPLRITEPPVVQPPAAEQPAMPKAVLFINGNLGDSSFFDSAIRGVEDAGRDMGYPVQVVEAGYDRDIWEKMFEDTVANEANQIIIAGSFEMIEIVALAADRHPDKKFIVFDVVVEKPNVYSITYKQNEGSYLAGYYAGLMTETNRIGVVGGMDIEIIHDFLIAYEQGARDANPDVQMMVEFVGNFEDEAAGYKLAAVMYEQGADIVYNVAGKAGNGVLNAAVDTGHYAIGVDVDQAMLIRRDKGEDAAQHILTSMEKRIDVSLYRALQMNKEGRLPYGAAEQLGLAVEGVGLAKNDIYEKSTPQEIKETMVKIQEMIVRGEIVVQSVFK